jgi:hypothetical protein
MSEADLTYGADRYESQLIIGLWRWYAPVALKNVGDDPDLISATAVGNLLKEPGFQSVEDLTRHLSPYSILETNVH